MRLVRSRIGGIGRLRLRSCHPCPGFTWYAYPVQLNQMGNVMTIDVIRVAERLGGAGRDETGELRPHAVLQIA
jgi:hypothetical protein